jgi:predicted nucleic acid-binding protein
MHVADTSTWVEFLRPSGNRKIQEELTNLIRAGNAAITDWIILELMVGIRSNQDSAHLLSRLIHVHRLPFPEDAWPRAWNLAASLRKKAVTPSASECLIATTAILHGAILVHCDSDYESIAKHEKNLKTLDWTKLL